MTTNLPTTDFGVEIPFVKHLGFVLTVFGGGLSEMTYEPRHEHLNSYSVTHGGALMTLLDVAMAMASCAPMPPVPSKPSGVCPPAPKLLSR